MSRTQYEVFSILGEVAGSGCPLGYLLIKSEKGSELGGKQRYIAAVLACLRDTWDIHAIVTVTDKDWSEINACRQKYPDARHQLCFWHFLRAIKRRLAVLRRQPAPYDFRDDFIDPKFVPVGQATELLQPEELIVPSRAIPHVNVVFQGQPVA